MTDQKTIRCRKAVFSQRKTTGRTCRQVVKQATEFPENRLSAAANADILGHLECCAGCRTYFEQMALVRESLRKLPEAEMPESMRRQLLRQLSRMARDYD